MASDPVTIEQWGALAHVEANEHAKLQTFFTKKDEVYVPAARFITSAGITRKIENFGIYDRLSPVILEDDSTSVRYDGNGLYELYDGSFRQCSSFICTGSNNKSNEEFFVKRIHHTGLTEELLNMPECSIALGSDSVELVFDNSQGHNNANGIYPYQTIIDPEQVKAIRDALALGKIFVINAQVNGNNDVSSYKVLRYKNNAYIHWDGWNPIRFILKHIGKNLELYGFDTAKDVQPEKQIEINLDKNWQQFSVYKTRKNLREMMYIFISFCIAFKLYDSLKTANSLVS